MPHLIIEYASGLAVEGSVLIMLDAVHNAAMQTGLFDESHIKTRAIPVKYYRTGIGQDSFIHAQLRIRSGRDNAEKKTLSESVLTAIVN